MTGWFKFEPFESCLNLPARPAVYVFYLGDRAVYVGQTSNLKSRMASYGFRYSWGNDTRRTQWGTFSAADDGEFTCKARLSQKHGDWAMWEIRLIRRLKPQFNTTHGGARVRLKAVK